MGSADHRKRQAGAGKNIAAICVHRRWWRQRRKIRTAKIVEAIAVPFDSTRAYFVAVELGYSDGDPETYLLPLAFAAGDRAADLCQFHADAVVAQLKAKPAGAAGDGILYDAVFDRVFLDALLDAVSQRRTFRGRSSEIYAVPSKRFRSLRGASDSILEPALAKTEQSNTSIRYGDRLILKIFPIARGVNPDLEIRRFITERTAYRILLPGG
jgi:hypothetical protein